MRLHWQTLHRLHSSLAQIPHDECSTAQSRKSLEGTRCAVFCSVYYVFLMEAFLQVLRILCYC